LVRSGNLRVKFSCFSGSQERRVDNSTRDVVELDGDLNRHDRVSDPPVRQLLEFITYTTVLERGSAREWICDDQLIYTCLECIIMNAGIGPGDDQEDILH
jgi:hypothetical protein